MTADVTYDGGLECAAVAPDLHGQLVEHDRRLNAIEWPVPDGRTVVRVRWRYWCTSQSQRPSTAIHTTPGNVNCTCFYLNNPQ